MAGEAELERLVVRLVGETGDYQQKMEEAAKASEDSGKKVEDQTKKIEGLGTGLQNFAGNVASAFAGLNILGWLQEALGNFQEAEGIGLRLTAILQSNGRAVEETTARYSDFANEMERLTTAEDDAVLSMLQVAETMGVTGDAAERAVRNAIALAAATGGSAEAFMRQMSALEGGNTQMLMRQLPAAIRSIADETQRAAAAQAWLARQFKVAEAEAASSSGMFKRMVRDYGNLLEDFGKVVADIIKPVVKAMIELVKWFKGLSDETKQTITLVAGLLVGLLAIGPLLTGISIVAGFIYLAISPIAIIVTAIGALIVLWVQYMGGVENAWRGLRRTAQAFWSWIKPAVTQLTEWLTSAWTVISESAGEAWEYIQEKATEFWDYIKPTVGAWLGATTALWDLMGRAASAVWEGITSASTATMEALQPIADFLYDTLSPAFEYISDLGATLFDATGLSAISNFDSIGETLTDFYIMAEFAFDHFEELASLAWTSTQLGFVVFSEEVIHFFTETIPATLDWFANNWQDIFTDVFNYTTTVFINLTDNLVRVFQNLPGLISGAVSWEEVWRPLTAGFERVSAELVIPERVVGETEASLRSQAEAQAAALAESWVEFSDRRRAEVAEFDILFPPAQMEKWKKDAEEVGEDLGDDLGSGMAKGIAEFDSVLSGSAEALSRITAYREKLAEMNSPTAPGGTRPGGAGGSTTPSGSTGGGAPASQGNAQQTQMISILQLIATATGALASRPPLELEMVNL